VPPEAQKSGSLYQLMKIKSDSGHSFLNIEDLKLQRNRKGASHNFIQYYSNQFSFVNLSSPKRLDLLRLKK